MREKIKECLNFYQITDNSYLEKCYLCYDELVKNPTIYQKFINLYGILYKNPFDNLRKLWKKKTIDELFGISVNPFTTNLLLLLGAPVHQENMKKLGFDSYQINKHLFRVRECLLKDIYERGYSGIRVSQLLWGVYFINGKLIEIDRLQYEYVNDAIIKIHIPGGSKLEKEKVLSSLKKSYDELKKYFEVKNFKYYCESWLLSDEIHSLLNRESNIYQFYQLFQVEKKEDCISDILNFLYHKNEMANYNTLQEDTYLQKIVKKELLNGTVFHLGIGVLKENKETE